jgi:hypothetical protein
MTYLVECYRPGVSEPEFAAALDGLDPAEACWLDAILVSTDEIVLCVIEGSSARAISGAASRAGQPSKRIVERQYARSQLDPSSALVSKGDL